MKEDRSSVLPDEAEGSPDVSGGISEVGHSGHESVESLRRAVLIGARSIDDLSESRDPSSPQKGLIKNEMYEPVNETLDVDMDLQTQLDKETREKQATEEEKRLQAAETAQLKED